MKKIQKVFGFIGISGLILFVVGNIIAINEGGWNFDREYQNFSIISFGNITAFFGLEILALILVGFVFYLSKFLWSKGVGKIFDIFYLLIIPALVAGILLTGIIYFITDFEHFHGNDYIISVLSEIRYLGGIFRAPLFWIIFAIIEIIMVGKLIFRPRTPKAENEL